MIEIYGKENCPFCVKAKALAESKEYEFKYVQLGVDFDLDELKELFPNARTFPQIRKVSEGGENEYIGGYTEFEKWSTSQSLGGLSL